MPEQHLALDALVAFVDGELSPSAYDRAASHLARCPACAADAAAQRQARAAVQAADTPSISPRLMQALQAIPSQAELPSQPDGLALTPDGQLVALTPGARGKSFGTGAVLGASTPLGGSRQPLGSSTPLGGDGVEAEPHARGDARGRRTRQGAGVVFSGLVLGALALMNLPSDDQRLPTTNSPLPLPGGAYGNVVMPASASTTSVAPESAAAQPAASQPTQPATAHPSAAPQAAAHATSAAPAAPQP
ncbi:zf-HC2 domain-containing protein [Saccharopolyspora erythraea]|nr:zf-HC2 domain-containing protein [Saccharopolyspora erythraea]